MKSAINGCVSCACSDLRRRDERSGRRAAKGAEEIRIRNQGILDQSAARLVPRRRDRGAKGAGAALGSTDRRVGRRTRRHRQEDQAAGRLQDRGLCLGRARRAPDGLGRQGHAVRRLLRARQCLCDQGQWRQERGQDDPEGPRHADRARLPGRLALRHRRQQADQVRERRSQCRQSRRRQGGV